MLSQQVDYWKLLFPDKDLDFEISAVFMYLNLFMLTLVVFVFPDMGYTIRIVGGFIGQSLILAFVPSSYFLHLTEGWNYVIVLGVRAWQFR
jgi:equilibrative nucleoside transporter 1/2/3